MQRFESDAEDWAYLAEPRSPRFYFGYVFGLGLSVIAVFALIIIVLEFIDYQ